MRESDAKIAIEFVFQFLINKFSENDSKIPKHLEIIIGYSENHVFEIKDDDEENYKQVLIRRTDDKSDNAFMHLLFNEMFGKWICTEGFIMMKEIILSENEFLYLTFTLSISRDGKYNVTTVKGDPISVELVKL